MCSCSIFMVDEGLEEIKGCSFVSYPQKVEGSFHLYKELKRLFFEIDFKYTDNVLETRKNIMN